MAACTRSRRFSRSFAAMAAALVLALVLAASAPLAASVTPVPILQASQHQVLRELVQQWGKFTGYRTWNVTAPRACNLYAGVKCGPAGFILNLTLPGANIKAPVGSLSKLTTLQYLDLNSNDFTSIAALAALTNLLYLDLSSATDIALFPTQFSKLTKLRHLDVTNCYFTGRLPALFSNLTQLTRLSLSLNPWEGSIPTGYGRLTNLQHLAISNTGSDGDGVSGSIPQSLSALKKLRHLQLNKNALRGPIPAFVASFTNLTYLRLANNGFANGAIPFGVTNLLNLRSLDLRYTLRTGNIPAAIGRLSKLTFLGLTANYLQGRIPSSFTSLVNLDFASLAGNYFVGLVPAIKGLTKLTHLDVSGNLLTGRFPPFVPPSLKELDISNNYFYGIPTIYYPNRTVACLGDGYVTEGNCLIYPRGYAPCNTVQTQKTAVQCQRFCRTIKVNATQCNGRGVCIPRSVNFDTGALGNLTCALA